jgi:arylsulfatase A-like enzyme
MTNIVYILADDLGFADLNPTFMPRTYALFESLGTQLQLQMSEKCAPSRAEFMTGQHAERFGLTKSYLVQDYPGLPVEQTLLSERFQDAGYGTGLFGKWHLGLAEEQAPWNQGFDHTLGFLHGQIEYFGVKDGPEIGLERYDDRAIGHAHNGGHDMLLNGTPIHSSQYSTFLFEDAAREWISDQAAAGEEFFAYVGFNAPHSPYSAPREYVDLYVEHFGITDAEYALLAAYEGDVLTIPYGARGKMDDATEQKLDELLYFASVRALDDAVADIYEEIVAAGIANDTLFMFASDNGARLPFGDNGPLKGAKGDLYEGAHRVANFIIWPGEIEAGEIIDDNIWVGDLYPTFLSIAGIDYGDDLDGVDVSPALRGEAFDRGTIVPHTMVTRPYILFSALDGDIKYIRIISVSRDGQGNVTSVNSIEEQLYDLSVDLGETNNLVNDPSYSSDLAAMRVTYDNFGFDGLTGDDYFFSRPVGPSTGELIVPEEWGSTFSWDDPRIIKYGTGSNDTMVGEPDADIFMGAAGDDIIRAAGGNDVLIGGPGADALFGGVGIDTASFEGAASGVIADLRAGGLAGEAAGDSYSLIENLTGSA